MAIKKENVLYIRKNQGWSYPLTTLRATYSPRPASKTKTPFRISSSVNLSRDRVTYS